MTATTVRKLVRLVPTPKKGSRSYLFLIGTAEEGVKQTDATLGSVSQLQRMDKCIPSNCNNSAVTDLKNGQRGPTKVHITLDPTSDLIEKMNEESAASILKNHFQFPVPAQEKKTESNSIFEDEDTSYHLPRKPQIPAISSTGNLTRDEEKKDDRFDRDDDEVEDEEMQESYSDEDDVVTPPLSPEIMVEKRRSRPYREWIPPDIHPISHTQRLRETNKRRRPPSEIVVVLDWLVVTRGDLERKKGAKEVTEGQRRSLEEKPETINRLISTLKELDQRSIYLSSPSQIQFVTEEQVQQLLEEFKGARVQFETLAKEITNLMLSLSSGKNARSLLRIAFSIERAIGIYTSKLTI
ncbi:hypothetical protein PROFUN_00577 [Planoprotostelium fungivorum]|uniref:Uncharacterized protein n=1 Tax=Planoprotostelium fungivorum TaxID=1890364 RepID=A0A2P6N170_9EUKA|nr:hypothetical protein PROFUN_00577 [Planoprotostelium fungivorum]